MQTNTTEPKIPSTLKKLNILGNNNIANLQLSDYSGIINIIIFWIINFLVFSTKDLKKIDFSNI